MLAPRVTNSWTARLSRPPLSQVLRDLERSRAHERAAVDAKEEAYWELRELSSTSRTRLRWLQHSNDELQRRISHYSRQLIASVPAPAYNALLEKCALSLRGRRCAPPSSSVLSARLPSPRCSPDPGPTNPGPTATLQPSGTLPWWRSSGACSRAAQTRSSRRPQWRRMCSWRSWRRCRRFTARPAHAQRQPKSA